MDAPARDLEALLALDLDRLREERAAALSRAVPAGTPLVLAGAGELGRRTLRGLVAAGTPPLAIVDNNRGLWGKELQGVPVLSPADAVAREGERAAFVVTTYNTAGLWEQLRSLGCRRILSYGLLYGGRFDDFLPFLCLADPAGISRAADDLRRAFELLADSASRTEFVAQVRARLLLGFDERPQPVAEARRSEEYFPADLYRPRADEVFVDCGAFDGDTVRRFLAQREGRFGEIHALEPDPSTFERLRASLAALEPAIAGRIRLHRLAAHSERGQLSFEADGSVAAGAAPGAATRVDCAPLDEILAEARPPTLVKMDLEGGEPEALAGAARTVAAHAPVLAVTVYHRQDHLWSLPLLVHRIRPDYRFFLRAHAEACWDATMYAVPRDRAEPRARS
jgi:FkbM family methyltransferase